MVRKTRIHFPGAPLPHRGFSDYDNWRPLSFIGQLSRLSEQQDPLPEKIPLQYLTAKNSVPATMAIRIIFWIIFYLIPRIRPQGVSFQLQPSFLVPALAGLSQPQNYSSTIDDKCQNPGKDETVSDGEAGPSPRSRLPPNSGHGGQTGCIDQDKYHKCIAD